MLRKLFFVSFILILHGCGGLGSDSSLSSVEMQDMNSISQTTYYFMLDCINIRDRNACKRADNLIKKYPWLLTGEVNITNTKGMSQGEWDVEKVVVRKNLHGIKTNYDTFRIVK